jgi:hypothetical protein
VSDAEYAYLNPPGCFACGPGRCQRCIARDQAEARENLAADLGGEREEE